LRSAIGAHFRLPISTNLSWDEVPTLINEESNIFLADNNITYKNEFENYTVNKESNNPIKSEDLIGFEDKDFCEVNFNDNIDYDSKDKEIDTLLDETKSNKSSAETKLLTKQMISQFPIVSYHTLDFTQRETILIIGGETEGINIESCKLLNKKNCVRINIPLTNGIDSLNVGIAIGIVTYEMKRQFMIRNIENE
jgi:tRNA(Leu) C34 or U34 (ribose-2'-O)-methylase TrmL